MEKTLKNIGLILFVIGCAGIVLLVISLIVKLIGDHSMWFLVGSLAICIIGWLCSVIGVRIGKKNIKDLNNIDNPDNIDISLRK